MPAHYARQRKEEHGHVRAKTGSSAGKTKVDTRLLSCCCLSQVIVRRGARASEALLFPASRAARCTVVPSPHDDGRAHDRTAIFISPPDIVAAIRSSACARRTHVPRSLHGRTALLAMPARRTAAAQLLWRFLRAVRAYAMAQRRGCA